MSLVNWLQPSSVVLCMQNNVICITIASLYGSQTSPVDLWKQNIVISNRITSLHWSQPSSVVFCMQNSDFRTTITSLYGPQTHLWFFAFKTANLAQEFQVSMGPRPHLSFCACKRTWLASEVLVSMGPRPHQWLFLLSKLRLFAQELQAFMSPSPYPVDLCMQNSFFWIRITSLYGSQTSSIVLCVQNRRD